MRNTLVLDTIGLIIYVKYLRDQQEVNGVRGMRFFVSSVLYFVAGNENMCNKV